MDNIGTNNTGDNNQCYKIQLSKFDHVTTNLRYYQNKESMDTVLRVSSVLRSLGWSITAITLMKRGRT